MAPSHLAGRGGEKWGAGKPRWAAKWRKMESTTGAAVRRRHSTGRGIRNRTVIPGVRTKEAFDT